MPVIIISSFTFDFDECAKAYAFERIFVMEHVSPKYLADTNKQSCSRKEERRKLAQTTLKRIDLC